MISNIIFECLVVHLNTLDIVEVFDVALDTNQHSSQLQHVKQPAVMHQIVIQDNDQLYTLIGKCELTQCSCQHMLRDPRIRYETSIKFTCLILKLCLYLRKNQCQLHTILLHCCRFLREEHPLAWDLQNRWHLRFAKYAEIMQMKTFNYLLTVSKFSFIITFRDRNDDIFGLLSQQVMLRLFNDVYKRSRQRFFFVMWSYTINI